jgi:DNA-binding MarR family transcriptional regulator
MSAAPAQIRSDRLENTFGALLVEAAARLQATLADRFSLGLSDASALIVLSRRSRRIEDLRQILGLTHSATVRLVDRLEAASLVERTPGPDRRSVLLKPTALGRRRASSVPAAREGLLAQLLAPLGREERDGLAAAAELMLTALSTDWWTALHVCRLCDLGKCEAEAECPAAIGARGH